MRTSTTYFLFAVLLLIAGRLGAIAHLGSDLSTATRVLQVGLYGGSAVCLVAGVVAMWRDGSPD